MLDGNDIDTNDIHTPDGAQVGNEPAIDISFEAVMTRMRARIGQLEQDKAILECQLEALLARD